MSVKAGNVYRVVKKGGFFHSFSVGTVITLKELSKTDDEIHLFTGS